MSSDATSFDPYAPSDRLYDAVMRLDPRPRCTAVLAEIAAEIAYQRAEAALGAGYPGMGTLAREHMEGWVEHCPRGAPSSQQSVSGPPEWSVRLPAVEDERNMLHSSLHDRRDAQSLAMATAAHGFWHRFVGDHVAFPGIVEQVAANEAARLPLWHLRGRAPFVARMLWWDWDAPLAAPREVPGVAVLIAPDLQHSDGALEAAALRWLRTLVDRAETLAQHADLLHY